MAVTQLLVSDAAKHIIHQTAVVRLVLTGQFSGDKQEIVLQQALDCHTAVLVVLETVGHNGIRNLVADFIGMAIADLLTGDDFTHRFFPRFHVITKQAAFAVARLCRYLTTKLPTIMAPTKAACPVSVYLGFPRFLGFISIADSHNMPRLKNIRCSDQKHLAFFLCSK